jgi:hypothetical protein
LGLVVKTQFRHTPDLGFEAGWAARTRNAAAHRVDYSDDNWQSSQSPCGARAAATILLTAVALGALACMCRGRDESRDHAPHADERNYRDGKSHGKSSLVYGELVYYVYSEQRRELLRLLRGATIAARVVVRLPPRDLKAQLDCVGVTFN